VEPFWQSTNAQLRPSDRPTANKAPAGSITGMAAVSGAQQPSSVQAQPAQFSAFARHFEENPVQGVTENEIRFGISAPFSGAAKELGQNMKLGIDAAFHVANAKGGVHGRQLCPLPSAGQSTKPCTKSGAQNSMRPGIINPST